MAVPPLSIQQHKHKKRAPNGALLVSDEACYVKGFFSLLYTASDVGVAEVLRKTPVADGDIGESAIAFKR